MARYMDVMLDILNAHPTKTHSSGVTFSRFYRLGIVPLKKQFFFCFSPKPKINLCNIAFCNDERNRLNQQNSRKISMEECIFDYIALHFECRFNKNSLISVFCCLGGAFLPYPIQYRKKLKFVCLYRDRC